MPIKEDVCRDNQKYLSREKIDEYTWSGGARCPYCGETNIEGSSIDINSGVATQGMSCPDCGRTWDDIYKLVSIYEHRV